MKCQKCGTSLTQDYLYCSECGTEYQIVPDFEPEIENSIANAMSDVGDTITVKQNKESILSIVEEKAELPFEEEKEKRKFSYSLIVCIFFVFCLLILTNYFYCNSVFYLKKQVEISLEEQDYNKAINYYTELRKKDSKNSLWYLKEAELEIMYGDRDSGIQLLYRGIEETGGNSEIYQLLLSLLVENREYQEVYHLLQECTYDEVKQRFKEYDSEVGTLSHEGGRYNEIIYLAVESPCESVYYTLDGSTPDLSSMKYTVPIPLGNGKHTISFISYNEYGISGKIIRNEYTINTSVPLEPQVIPESGTFEQPVWIEVNVEPGTKVYYTTDGNHPTKESIKYDGPIPLPLGNSKFSFVAISKNNIISKITERTYQLLLAEDLSVEEAEKILMEGLIYSGHILDINGAIKDRYGVFRYFYRFPLEINGEIYHVFEEHYLENLIDNALGNYYGVNMKTKNIYPLSKDHEGKYHIAP